MCEAFTHRVFWQPAWPPKPCQPRRNVGLQRRSPASASCFGTLADSAISGDSTRCTGGTEGAEGYGELTAGGLQGVECSVAGEAARSYVTAVLCRESIDLIVTRLDCVLRVHRTRAIVNQTFTPDTLDGFGKSPNA